MSLFGERLKRARERKGMTQAQVMKATGISDKSLSRYENGASSPDPNAILRLIQLYDVSADYVMGLSPIMGHAYPVTSGNPLSASSPASGADIHEKLEELSDAARKKAEEYIDMLQALDNVRSGSYNPSTPAKP